MKHFAITDIHGMFDLLLNALHTIYNKYPDEDVTIIFLGDYIDRGPKSKQVVDLLMAGPAYIPERRNRKDVWIILKGNHEDMMVNALQSSHTSSNYRHFVQNGGDKTLQSFKNVDNIRHYIDWMDSLPTSYETKFHFFCHAGIWPDKPLKDQDEKTLLWIRDRFLQYPYKHEKYIIHGHTPNDQAEVLDNRCNLDSGAVWTNILSIAEIDITQPSLPNVYKITTWS